MVLQNVSPLSTDNEILNALQCKDKVSQIDMNFHEIPDEGLWFGEAHLRFNNEQDLSKVKNKNYKIRGVPITFARGNFDGRHYKSACEGRMSDCDDVISSISSSLAEMKTDEILFVKNLKRSQSKAFELKNTFRGSVKFEASACILKKIRREGILLSNLTA